MIGLVLHIDVVRSTGRGRGERDGVAADCEGIRWVLRYVVDYRLNLSNRRNRSGQRERCRRCVTTKEIYSGCKRLRGVGVAYECHVMPPAILKQTRQPMSLRWTQP